MGKEQTEGETIRKRLYATAAEFRRLAPWKWMDDSDVFGVRDPKTGTIGFCSIMGAKGLYVGLAIYMGEEGLACLDRIFNIGLGPGGDDDLLYEQNNINLHFGERREVLPKDLEAMKSIGIKCSGQQAWPVFRRFLPGFYPWYLTEEEMEYTAIVLE